MNLSEMVDSTEMICLYSACIFTRSRQLSELRDSSPRRSFDLDLSGANVYVK